MIKYYQKKSRENLNDEYIHVQIHGAFYEYQKSLDGNEDVKKLRNNHILTKKG